MTETLRCNAVLLDMDGTLVDSSAVVERVWTEWAVAHGLDVTAVLAVIHGRRSLESMRLLSPDRPDEQNLVESAELLRRETGETDGVVEIRGAREFLHGLADVPHALVTSADIPLARARMSAAGLLMPAVTVTAEDVTNGKPHPDGFLLGAERLGVLPASCVVFEDSEAGIEAGHRAGMRVVGVGANAGRFGADFAVPDLSPVKVSQTDDYWTLTLHHNG